MTRRLVSLSSIAVLAFSLTASWTPPRRVVRAAGGADQCAGATNWTTHADRKQCSFITDTSWVTAAEPDDECGQAAASGSTGLTAADDAKTDTPPAGSGASSYYLQTTSTEVAQLQLDGTDGDMGGATDWFASVWVRPQTAGAEQSVWVSNALGGDDIFFYLDDNGASPNSPCTGDNCVCNYHSGNDRCSADTKWAVGTWVHLILYFDSADEGGGSDRWRIFVNGIEQGTAPNVTSADGGNDFVLIGSGANGAVMSEDLHEFLVVDAALTASQACQLYLCGASGASATAATRSSTYGACTP